jgi:hypothetical protein
VCEKLLKKEKNTFLLFLKQYILTVNINKAKWPVTFSTIRRFYSDEVTHKIVL